MQKLQSNITILSNILKKRRKSKKNEKLVNTLSKVIHSHLYVLKVTWHAAYKSKKVFAQTQDKL